MGGKLKKGKERGRGVTRTLAGQETMSGAKRKGKDRIPLGILSLLSLSTKGGTRKIY